MKLLPINKEPFIRTYPSYSFIDSIINNELTTGKKLAEIKISDYEKYEWKKQTNVVEVHEDGDVLTFYAEPYEKSKNISVYRACGEFDEIEVKVEFQQFAYPFGNICVFVNDSDMSDLDVLDYFYSHVFGKYCGLGFFSLQGKMAKETFRDTKYLNKYPYWMKIKKNQNELITYISFDRTQWEEMGSGKRLGRSGGCSIGIRVNLSDNNYYNWVFSNFIQLYGGSSTNLPLPIQYSVYPQKNRTDYLVSPFTDYFPEKKINFFSNGRSVWENITKTIDNGRYISLELDEFFVPGSFSYKTNHYMHSNLIYGYDEEKMNIFIICFVAGKPEPLVLTYEDFKNSLDACPATYEYAYLNLINYNVSIPGYSMDVKRICQLLKDYLDGRNSIEDMGGIANPLDSVSGINLYDDYIKDERSINKIICDPRISYIFHEHKLIMKERLKYLIVRKVVDAYEVEDITKSVNDLSIMSKKMMRLIMKNKVKAIADVNKRVTECMIKMKETEAAAYTKLYGILTAKLRAYP